MDEDFLQRPCVFSWLIGKRFNTDIASCSWDVIEREPGKYDFTSVDHMIRNARANGLKVVMIFSG